MKEDTQEKLRTECFNTQYEIDFVCNPEKRDQIIADVEKRKAKLLEDAGLSSIED